VSEQKPFPKPPFVKSRSTDKDIPFGNPNGEVEEDPRLKDDDIRLLFTQFLRPDHLKDERILKFILSYCTNRNASQAARESGLGGTGTYWRQRPDIHACIEAMTQRMLIKHGYDSHEVIERVKEIATIDPIEFQNPDGSYKTHLSDIRPEARRAIKKFKCKNIFGVDDNGMPKVAGILIEIELWDKMKANEMLGSEKNIFKKTTVVQHDVTTNMKDVLLESGNRAEERLRLMAARDVTEDTDVRSGLGSSPVEVMPEETDPETE
jgi:hypothetical protein